MNEQEIIKGLVSVIIPTYNGRRWIGRAIDSVLVQSYRIIEIIVVDDCSTDDTIDFISTQYPDVRVHRQNSNKGPSAARNAGIRIARGEFIAFLDSDDIWLPNKLEIQLNAVNKSDNWGICSTQRFKFRANQAVIYPKVKTENKKIIIVDHLQLLKHNYVFTSSVIVNRSALIESNGFDETLKRAEDWDLWLRISKKWKILIVDAPLIGYQRTPGSLSANRLETQYNILRILEKWSNQYPVHVERLSRQAKSSLVRKLLRQGYRDEAAKVFFGDGLARQNWIGHARFWIMSVIWRLQGKIDG